MKNHFYAFADILKHSEGGITKKDAKDIGKRLGIETRTGYSPFVGHFRVLVKTENKRKLERFAKELGV